MSDNDKSLPNVPVSRAVPKKQTRLSFVWIIPIVAAAAGIWVAVTRIMSQGPEITIAFQTAEGLAAGKTKIQYNGVEIGTITKIRISDDYKGVVAIAQMAPKTEGFLYKDTKFWVVRPRISGLNISGLGTLLSGDYIGLEIGQSRENERSFVALETPPVVSSDTPGRFFMLKTPELGSLDAGTPIYFRQLQAGQVISYELDKDGQSMNVKIFIQAPYDQYVTPNTRFWHASGIEMSVSANGLHVQTESLMSILAGGIAFETPTAGPVLPPAEADTVFTLNSDRVSAFSPPVRDPQTFVLVFKVSSVRGLVAGAPVELGGVKIGEVTQVSPQFNMKTFEFSVPVTVQVDPQRFGVQFLDMPPGGDAAARHHRVMDTLVSRGLRAQLKTGSMLTGSLYVAVDFFPDAPPVTLDWSQNPVLLPTVPGGIEQLEAKVESIMKKLDQMQFKEISDDLRKSIGDLDKTLVSAHGTLTNADRLVGSANKLVNHTDDLIEPNSVLDTQLNNMLMEGGGAARALRVLADYLERHPEALIRGKTGEAK